ncbi:MAG: ankyrin repeat domain-containing protein [Kangiellaceae bacterium]|nr:ankyrin repeat domain-containing protein [Kangiellaceae bacterium]
MSAFDYNKKAKLVLLDKRTRKSKKINNKALAKKQLVHQLEQLKKQIKDKNSPYFNWPLLPVAVSQDQTELANYLLQQGSSPWQKASDDKTAISIAMEKGDLQLLRTMTSKFPIKSHGNKTSIEKLFFLAIEKDHEQFLTPILNRAKSLGLDGLPGKGLLQAVKQQNLESTLLFLKIKTGPIDSQLVNVSITSEKNAYKITKLLLERGLSANIKNGRGQTPLVIAAKCSNVKILSILAKRKIDLNETDTGGLTALMWASKQGCVKCVKVLLDHGVDVDLQSKTGNTALILSTSNQPDIVNLLLRSEPDLSIRNNQSFTALMLSVTNNCLDCVKTLLAEGANPKRKNAFGLDSFVLAKDTPRILDLLNNH